MDVSTQYRIDVDRLMRFGRKGFMWGIDFDPRLPKSQRFSCYLTQLLKTYIERGDQAGNAHTAGGEGLTAYQAIKAAFKDAEERYPEWFHLPAIVAAVATAERFVRHVGVDPTQWVF